MTLTYAEPALTDLRRIGAWYRRRRPEGLEPFLRRLRDTLKRIERSPTTFPVALERRGRMLRRARILRSDYSIAFEVYATDVVVHGVIHGARDPREWTRMLADTR
jgi:plasmid stabilization system protein ParE